MPRPGHNTPVSDPLPSPAPSRPILSVRRLRVHYPLASPWPWQRAGTVRAIDDVHFNLNAGEALGILGEAGCGKSTLARALAGLQPVTGGGIVYEGRDLARLDPAQWRAVRRDIQMVFQDPIGSLDPRMTAAQAVAEPLEALCPELDDAARHARIAEGLGRVGLAQAGERYPHELSRDACQRVGIARALAVRPRILVCDEPVSALDPDGRARIGALLTGLRREQGLSMIVIAQQPGVLPELCQRVVVLYLGRIMEQAGADELFARPKHPYTRSLLASASAGPGLEGEPPSAAQPPSGCVFRTRCAMADDLCAREVPYLRRVSESGHAACHYVHGEDESVRDGTVGKARLAGRRQE